MFKKYQYNWDKIEICALFNRPRLYSKGQRGPFSSLGLATTLEGVSF